MKSLFLVIFKRHEEYLRKLSFEQTWPKRGFNRFHLTAYGTQCLGPGCRVECGFDFLHFMLKHLVRSRSLYVIRVIDIVVIKIGCVTISYMEHRLHARYLSKWPWGPIAPAGATFKLLEWFAPFVWIMIVQTRNDGKCPVKIFSFVEAVREARAWVYLSHRNLQ